MARGRPASGTPLASIGNRLRTESIDVDTYTPDDVTILFEDPTGEYPPAETPGGRSAPQDVWLHP